MTRSDVILCSYSCFIEFTTDILIKNLHNKRARKKCMTTSIKQINDKTELTVKEQGYKSNKHQLTKERL